MKPTFTAHNIRLDDASTTMPNVQICVHEYPWFKAARRILDTVFPGDKSAYRLADLGCLEGGYSVEFARMGFNVIGIEIRDSNLAACHFAKSQVSLPNLDFLKDDAYNVEKYGPFDAIFCCGLLYHLQNPRAFLETVSRATRKLVILQTHFAPSDENVSLGFRLKAMLPGSAQLALSKLVRSNKFNLSSMSEHEGLRGRWYTEFFTNRAFAKREDLRWNSWDNRRSFWIQREYLLQLIQDVGFNVVAEQFDGLQPPDGDDQQIAQAMLEGYYKTDSRGTFIGIK